MNDTTPEQARTALDAIGRARETVAVEVGLPRWYWWAMAGGWLALGVIGDFGPAWLVTVATIGFGVAHSVVASRLLDGRRRTDALVVSRSVADRRIPVVVIGMLLVLVGLTVAAAFALGADGVGHPQVWSALLVAMVIGFGGPEILHVLRRWIKA